MRTIPLLWFPETDVLAGDYQGSLICEVLDWALADHVAKCLSESSAYASAFVMVDVPGNYRWFLRGNLVAGPFDKPTMPNARVVEPDTHAPNLDALTYSELQNFSHSNETLMFYATQKAKAMRLRLAGRINDACTVEDRLERVYESLPSELKW